MKEALRKEGLNKRNQMSCDEIVNLSNKIIKQIKKRIDFESYQVFGFYMPLGNEVDLRPLMEELINLGKTIVLPKVHDKKQMEFYPIQRIDEVHVGKYQVLEPNSKEKMPKTNIKIMFIPGIYFSYDGYRLGFGGGYYDRYLEDYPHLKIGVCYSYQHITSIPTNCHDIPMDDIITENP